MDPIARPTRRDSLKLFGAALSSALLGLTPWTRAALDQAAEATTAPNRKPGSFRIAQLTDFHIQSPRAAARGVAQCLRHVQSLPDRPDLILNTGDCIMDSLHATESHVAELWGLWTRTLKDELSLPIKHSLGNHDVWGWDRKRSQTTGAEPRWGKRWALDVLGLDRPYHAFDAGGWRVIMLDSMMPAPEGTEGDFQSRLDDEQFAWLESQLAADAAKPVLITSHCPIISPASMLDVGSIAGTPDAPAINGRRVHLDSKRIGQLFLKHPNVKLCLSGHLHQIDRADYRGVTYLTNPAVSGNWWKGKHLGTFGEMYTVLDLHPDGTFDHRHVSYGWTAEEK